MIVIVDNRTGNLGSIKNILKRCGHSSVISSNVNDISRAEKLILPGVGSFDTGMTNLRELGLIETLNNRALDEKVPILGICLGMQLMSQSSEEGKLPGLGWIKARTIRFRKEELNGYRVPNMGWNTIKPMKVHPLMSGINDQSAFYFVHSYHVVCEESEDVLSTTDYGITFTSAFSHRNIMGTQFHPEKSLKWGIEVLNNFANM